MIYTDIEVKSWYFGAKTFPFMRIFYSAAFVMILIMGWGVYVKETYVPPDLQANPPTSQVTQATLIPTQLPATTQGSTASKDTQSPTSPTSLIASAINQNQISLKWTSSHDDTAVTGYRILQDGHEIGTTTNNFYYIDTPLSSVASHTYTIVAYDSAGNSSPTVNADVSKISLAGNGTSTIKPTPTPKPVSTTPRPTPRSTPIPTIVSTGTVGVAAQVTSVVTDVNGANMAVTGVLSAIRYSTNLVSDLPTTLVSGRHSIVWPQGTTFACYQAQGTNGIWTPRYCNNVTPATASSEVIGVTTDANGATVSISGLPSAIRYSTNLVSNLSVTLSSGRHSIVWPQGTTFACYQAHGSNGIWTSTYCNNVTPGAGAPIATPVPTGTLTPTPTATPTTNPTATPTNNPTPIPTSNPTPTPTPTANPTPIPTSNPTPTPTPAPTSTFSANPTSIISGQSSTLSWSSTNANSCTASGGWSGAKATSGTQSISPTISTTYTLACTGGGGTVTKNTTVSVSAPTPTPTPTPPPSGCGSGGACTAADIAPHNSRANCWVYLRSPTNKAYNITNYVANGSSNHPGGDVIVPYCGGDIYDVFINNSGGHRHSNSALNNVLQAYYIGPFQ